MDNRASMVSSAFLVACGLAASGYFIGQTLYNSKRGENTAEVKGLAERRVSADRAFWRIDYTLLRKGDVQLDQLYRDSERDQARIVKMLKDNGFDSDEMRLGVVEYQKSELRNSDQKLVEERHRLCGSIEIETGKVRQVAAVRARLNQLIAEGVDITNNAPNFQFTRLNQIKPEMVKEATQNARKAATEFALNAGVQVGGIKSAEQGGFSIRDVGDENSDSRSLEKDVRLVTSISFYLTGK
ncbi:MAG: hypothetical protein RL095_3146 [Verrucomicrobiota bacterium]|jgi:hypothetical protein